MESYDQWAKKYYKVFTIPKKDAILLGKNRVRPMRLINVVLEIVGEKGDEYLVRNLPPEDPQAVGHDTWWRNEGTEIFMKMKDDYFKDKYLIVDNPDVPPPFVDKVRFALRDQGLPHGGRWQMSFDIADMNGDGLPDLVFGPQRTGEEATGYIFLQQKDHSWQLWRDTKWPTRGLKLDYGTVRVADFDGDGNKDIAIACHFSKTYVLYGNGKGDFTRFVTVPQTNQGMTSRALTVGDFNGDGRPDIATYAEVDLDMGSTSRLTSGLVNVALNLPSGWKAVAKNFFPEGIQGDWLTAADVLGVGSDQILLTSRAQNVMDLVFRNGGGGEKWDSTARLSFPVNAYVFANAVGPLDRFKQPDLLECFEQFNPWKVEPPTQSCVIYRFHDAQGQADPDAGPDRALPGEGRVPELPGGRDRRHRRRRPRRHRGGLQQRQGAGLPAGGRRPVLRADEPRHGPARHGLLRRQDRGPLRRRQGRDRPRRLPGEGAGRRRLGVPAAPGAAGGPLTRPATGGRLPGCLRWSEGS